MTFDLKNTSNMSTANKLLRQYYGLDAPDKAQESRDIDSPHFDAKAFFDDSAKNDTLQQILSRENGLVSDIRTFDNDLQALVYDNYSKFLGAADTVHLLSDNISTLTSQMEKLKTNLSDVAGHSDAIVNDLEPNRQRIQRLVGISRLLGRVEFISKLPNQLRACLRQEKYEAAVNVWTKVETILYTQQHFPSFKQIHEDCSKIMEEIKLKIRGQILNTEVSVADSIMYATLLIKLKEIPMQICSQLAHHRFLIIDNNLEYDQFPEEPFEALAKLKELAIDDEEVFIRLYKEKLVPFAKNEDEALNINGVLTEFMKNTFEQITKLLPAKILFDLDCNKVASYITLFEKTMEQIATPQQISKHLHVLLQQYSESRAMAVFEEFKNIVNEKTGAELYDIATSKFGQSCSSLINEFQVLVMMNHRECSDFLIHQLAQMFEQMFDFFKTCDPKNSLILAMIALVLSENEIPRIFDQLVILDSNSPLASIQDKLSLDCKAAAKQCLSRFVSAQRLKDDRIIIQGMKSVDWESIQQEPTEPSKCVDDFITIIDNLFTEVTSLLSLTKSARQDGLKAEQDIQPTKSRSSNPVNRSGSFFTSNKVNFDGTKEPGLSQIERLFMSVNRLHLSQELGFDAQIILGSIIMYTLKSLLEFVRKSVFSCHGFNQIQINGYFLCYALEDKVTQQDLFTALIEEIISSAAERTIDPVPLDVNTLQKIYDEYDKARLAINSV